MDVMLDLETLGVKPGSVIVSIAAVAFPREPGAEFDLSRAPHFYAKLDLFPQIAAGMTIDKSTVIDFWQREPEAVGIITRDVHVHNPATALAQLWKFVGAMTTSRDDSGPGLIWAQGQSFDFPLVHALHAAVGDLPGAPTLWPFWAERDTRSVYTMARMADPKFNPKDYRIGVPHYGLDDCRSQVLALREAIRCCAHVPAPKQDMEQVAAAVGPVYGARR